MNNWQKYDLNKELFLYQETYLNFFDFIMGLGESCFVSQELRAANLQNCSCPFDWSGAVNWKGEIWPEAGKLRGLERKIKLLINECTDILNISDLIEFEGDPCLPEHPHRWIRNKRTGLQYIHDFSLDKSISDAFQEVQEKYQRRIKRMYAHFNEPEDILLAFFSRNLPIEDIIQQTKLVSEKFPKPNISWLFALNDDSIKENEIFVKTINNIIILRYPEKNSIGELNTLLIQKILSPFGLKNDLKFKYNYIYGRKIANCLQELKKLKDEFKLYKFEENQYSFVQNSVIKNDEGKVEGINLPLSIAPYYVQIIPKLDNEDKVNDANELYEKLSGKAILDDRDGVNIGAKIKDAKILGTPYVAIFGDKTEKGSFELENTKTGEKQVLKVSDFTLESIKE